ncbi:polyprenyl synthetase family protein [Streptomyces sp. NPDC057101]|uniref:polyprenyl synthetase family protein n=1 Tax=Streptomyces sp. NPDC057101 TaxID=3346020 RepID=UPI0036294549
MIIPTDPAVTDGVPAARKAATDAGSPAFDVSRWAQPLELALDALYAAQPGQAVTGQLCASDGFPAGLSEMAGRRLHEALVQPVRYVVEAGGARWRPQLLLAVIDMLGADSARFGPLAAAMELMHTGSLMIDDVQDRAVLRRGRVPAHAVFGLATTLNAGTAAYFAFDQVLRSVDDDPVLRSAMYQVMLGALRSAHAGQGLDLQGHRAEMDVAAATGRAQEVLDLVRLTHRLKSGAPVRACMEAGALLAGAAPQLQAALGSFGDAVGTSYQVIDDVLDLDGVVRGGQVTKKVGEDLFNGKVTMPLAHAVGLLPRREMQRLWKGVRNGRASAWRVRRAAAALRACGALQVSRDEAYTAVRREWANVTGLVEDSPARRAVWVMADQAVRRTRIA